MVAVYTTFKEYNAFYLEITPACYKFVNDCNHIYKFCLTFCSHMRLNLPRVVLLTRNLHFWIQENLYQVTHFHFKEQYSVNLWCGVLGNSLIDHMCSRDIMQSCCSHIHPLAARGTLFNPLNPKLNPICYLLALLGAHHFLHISRIRVKLLTFRLLMSYIYIYIYIWSTHS